MRSPSTRPPGRPKQSENLSIPDTILRVASHLFMDCGYDPVSLDMIAEAAEITKASIYYYFPTKADVFTAAVESLLKIIHRQSKRILTGKGALSERLLRLTEVRLSVAETRYDFDRVISEAQPQLNDDQLHRVRRAMHNLADLLSLTFDRAIQDGELNPCDTTFAAHAYMATLNVAYVRSVSGERLFLDRKVAAESIVSLLLSGIAPGKPKASPL